MATFNELTNGITEESAIESRFKTGMIPNEEDFENLIRSGFNQKDDGLHKDADSPLSIRAGKGGEQNVLLFYEDDESEAAWRIGIANGLNVKSESKDVLTILPNGNIGIGTTGPKAQLVVFGAKLDKQEGSSVNLFELGSVGPSNYSHLTLSHKRYKEGDSWISSELKLQQIVDVTPMHYISFRGTGAGSTLNLGFDNDDAITILNNGHVGIGTSDPKQELTIVRKDDNNADLRLHNNSGHALDVFSGTTKAGLYSYGERDLELAVNGEVALTINSDGNLGIGGDPSEHGLYVQNGIKTSLLEFENNSNINAKSYEASDDFYDDMYISFSNRNPNGKIKPELVQGSLQIGYDIYKNPFINPDGSLSYERSFATILVIQKKYLKTPTGFMLGNFWVLGDFGATNINASSLKLSGNLEVEGNLNVGGAKSGYVTDLFINDDNHDLEVGDVVIIDKESGLFYGKENNIPVVSISLSKDEYDSSVCGIISGIINESEFNSSYKENIREDIAKIVSDELSETPNSQEGNEEAFSNLEKIRKGSIKKEDKISRKKISTGDIGRMVTLGAFAHCKVDADIAPIQIGDLLTTSTTKAHAQKVLDRTKAVGAIIGKALASLDKGKGKIPVMVFMQ